MEPLRSAALDPQNAAARKQFPEQAPRVDVAIDVDLPCVKSCMPWVRGGAQKVFLLEAFLYFVLGSLITTLHHPVEPGIEAMGPAATVTAELIAMIAVEIG